MREDIVAIFRRRVAGEASHVQQNPVHPRSGTSSEGDAPIRDQASGEHAPTRELKASNSVERASRAFRMLCDKMLR